MNSGRAEVAFALLLDEPARGLACELQAEFSRVFGPSRAEKLEPHVTVKAPFAVSDPTPYHQHLGHIASHTKTIAGRLTRIELFPEGVVHVAVDQAPELQPLTDRLLAELGREALPSIYEANHTIRHHVTLGSVTPNQLERARIEFLGRTFNLWMDMRELALFVRRGGQEWEIGGKAALT